MSITKAGEINIEYYVEGEGPPLLLIMGYSGQALSWGEPFLAPLRERFRVIRFSNRGTGLSDKPESPTTIRQMADDAVNLLDAAGVAGAHICGISMGGMIAQEVALTYPERVRGLVLGCTASGGAHGPQAAPEVMAMMMPVPGMSREEMVRKAWPAICSAPFIETRGDFLEEMLRASLEHPTPIRTLGTQMAAILSFDAYDRLPQIKAPTLVVHGDVDVLVPPGNGRLLHERIPGSELVMLPGAAHMFFWEQPAAAAGAITEFLSRVPAGSHAG
ncbi:MAG: alpha/beta fold hydrolase [Dehalococcoidia bacterium]|nr:alpha/beta fold hydrolase [Dehalococcoidia bacterium]